MPSNLNKLVQARMAKTGESYQTALRHVRAGAPSPGGAFEALAIRIIRLAKARFAEYASRREDTGSDDLDQAQVSRWLTAKPSSEATALLSAVISLSERDLKKLQALVYYGRDGIDYAGEDNDDIHTVHRHLPRDKHEIKVRMVVGKMPLDEYLAVGLARAKREGVNLEGDF